jgi:hypothetical protein
MTPAATAASLVRQPAVNPARMSPDVMAILSRAQFGQSYQHLLSYLAGPLYPRIQRVFWRRLRTGLPPYRPASTPDLERRDRCPPSGRRF